VRNLLKSQIRFRQAAIVGGLLCFGGLTAGAQATQLSVSASPAAMKITTATAGFPPNSASDISTTYSCKTNGTKKITGQLSSVMPPGMTLTITLVAVPGATSQGAVPLDATARDLVISITNNQSQTAGITYVLSATAAAGVVTSQSRIVTFTIVNYP
jgi:hypothetical protein